MGENVVMRVVFFPKRFGKDNHFYGKKHSDEYKKYISELNKGRPSPRKNVVLSDEQRKKQSDSMKNLPSVECPHCGKIGKPSGMKRYHFDNCKHIVRLTFDNE